ncbi:amino acid adenylation domain-containing protein [Calothrix sp. FACHB-1219]|uniref:non-ribosomal peptide synthetase n=1 Tax=unclassified Calothrix TaxID=2619626 RepID=UPI001683BEA7|nr:MULTISPECIES: non-ribosomal peptide synthetase [unclassified Calothrix]MBD2207317.1 amino acid adenylation domain-containing protein [Calothrix sp. FACHB-168]MBD2221938.1 amino acid adenylation domain-containing protein [Calothrix sp. FACHB-1219]
MANKNIDEQRSQLSAAKQALLAKRLRGNLTTSSSEQAEDSLSLLPVIVPNPEQKYLPFPLNDMQQAYWIGRNSFMELGNVSIHAYCEIEMVDLDIKRLNLAWQRLIERHDMLRAIVLPDGQQQILEQVPAYQIQLRDFRGQDPEIIALELEKTRDRMSHQVLPSHQWPLFEICASRVSDRLTRIHISIDGIFFDAWSYRILFLELIQLYQAPQIPLQPLELSFRDYVLALVALQASPLFQRSLEYWQHRILTLPPAPELPLVKNPSSLSHPKFVRRHAQLEPEAWLRLKNRAAKANLTATGLLLAVYAEVLAVWSKSPRFTINVPRFDRLPLHPQVNKIIGEFASSTLLEVDNSQQNSFEVRAQRIQQQLWQDLEHQFVSSVRVLRELAHNRRNILGATMPVVFTSTPKEVEGRDSSQITDWPADIGEIVYSLAQTPQVWLDFQYNESADGLEFNLDAVEDLFPTGMVDDIFTAYCRLLQNLAEQEEPWQEQTRQLVPPAQLAQRAASNATAAPIPEETLHSLFISQALQRPQQVAVVATNKTLTYEELYRHSHQIARHLQHLGVQPNTLVAVVMEKGWEQIVAVLGILISGAAYLPIDPNLPKERLWYLLENGKVQQVLTQSWLNNTWEWPEGIHRLCVDTAELTNENHQPLKLVNEPDNLAYVIYTSGSTGLPKGVMIAHRGVVNAIIYTNQRFGVSPTDRVLALTALHHDMSVFDIFGVLAAGGAIVMPAASAKRDPTHWSELIQKQQITIWNSVPAMMEMLVEYFHIQPQLRFESLRLAFLGGDWIGLTLPDKITAIAPRAQVVSVGGPTETTLWNICYPITTIDQNWKSIPYGQAIANCRYYILNDALEDCPVWVAGQIYCAGIGLAKGYWEDEEKTRASFITHPRTQERLYSTGDLGRYLPDGNIEFLGRVDFQLNILGHRIEPGEIEASLAQHPGVRTAVVTSVGEQQDKQQLVAYVVLHPNQITTDELRSFLSEKLPAYMVPSTFIVLDALPLTPNGKIDRQALPAIESWRSQLAASYVMPQTEIERNIANIWRIALNIEKIGIHDNFFELGGNSLLMVKVHSQLCAVLKIELSMVDMFRYPTISSLLKHLNIDKQNTLFASQINAQTEEIKAGKNHRKNRMQKLNSINDN